MSWRIGASSVGGISAVGTAIVEPLRRDHDGQPGIGAVAQDGAVLRLDEQLDADLAPELGDQRQPVDDEAALAVGLDDDLELAAVGQEADAGAVALRQADLVEEPGRFRRVVLARMCVRSSGENSGLSARTVLLPSMPRPKRSALLSVLRSMPSDRARRKRTSRFSVRHTGSAVLRLG